MLPVLQYPCIIVKFREAWSSSLSYGRCQLIIGLLLDGRFLHMVTNILNRSMFLLAASCGVEVSFDSSSRHAVCSRGLDLVYMAGTHRARSYRADFSTGSWSSCTPRILPNAARCRPRPKKSDKSHNCLQQ